MAGVIFVASFQSLMHHGSMQDQTGSPKRALSLVLKVSAECSIKAAVCSRPLLLDRQEAVQKLQYRRASWRHGAALLLRLLCLLVAAGRPLPALLLSGGRLGRGWQHLRAHCGCGGTAQAPCLGSNRRPFCHSLTFCWMKASQRSCSSVVQAVHPSVMT